MSRFKQNPFNFLSKCKMNEGKGVLSIFLHQSSIMWKFLKRRLGLSSKIKIFVSMIFKLDFLNEFKIWEIFTSSWKYFEIIIWLSFIGENFISIFNKTEIPFSISFQGNIRSWSLAPEYFEQFEDASLNYPFFNI